MWNNGHSHEGERGGEVQECDLCFIVPRYMVEDMLDLTKKKLEDLAHMEGDVAMATNTLNNRADMLERHIKFQAVIDEHEREYKDKLAATEVRPLSAPPALSSARVLSDEALPPFTQAIYNMHEAIDPVFAAMLGLEKTDKGIRKLPGELVHPNSFAQEPTAQQVFDMTQKVYEFYDKHLHRKSIDDANGQLVSSIHYAEKFAQAFWIPSMNQMVYGDGSGAVATDFVQLDVVAHEITHGVVTHAVKLIGRNESGALTEHFADVVGITAKHWKDNTPFKKADWMFAKGVLDVGVALRSFTTEKASVIDTMPRTRAEMEERRKQAETDYSVRRKIVGDSGGVHYICGIPSYAFYLFCQGLGENTKSWELPLTVWYNTLLKLSPYSDFEDFATLTVVTAQEVLQRNRRGVSGVVSALSSDSTAVVQKLVDAWRAVGYEAIKH